ncbi:MAG: AraC family transcriptional regulator [Proteobacteria bacterium]|nr:AraC family transcriptional regulator [Pseudomonadota bacterium]
MEELGECPEALIREIGLNPMVLDNPDLYVPNDMLIALLELAAEKTACPHLGFFLSQRQDISVIGYISLLVLHSRTVGQALHSFVKYYYLHDRAAELELKREGELVFLSYLPKGVERESRVVAELAMGFGLQLMRTLCGSDWEPVEFHSALKTPSDPDFFKNYFQAPILYDQEHSQSVFEASILEKKFPGVTSTCAGMPSPTYRILNNNFQNRQQPRRNNSSAVCCQVENARLKTLQS